MWLTQVLAFTVASVFQTTRKCPICWFVFLVPEDTIQTADGEMTSVVLARTGLCMLQYQPLSGMTLARQQATF